MICPSCGNEHNNAKFCSRSCRARHTMTKNNPMHRPEVVEKISESLKGNDYGKGRRGLTHSEETKRRISEAKTGTTLSAETRQKMSDARQGHTWSSEVKEKISDSLTGKPKSEEHRRSLSESLKGKYVHSDAPAYKDGGGTYRERALDHYGEVCYNCGATEDLHVHHVLGDHSTHEVEYLAVLCALCHNTVAHDPVKRRRGEPCLNEGFRDKILSERGLPIA